VTDGPLATIEVEQAVLSELVAADHPGDQAPARRTAHCDFLFQIAIGGSHDITLKPSLSRRPDPATEASTKLGAIQFSHPSASRLPG